MPAQISTTDFRVWYDATECVHCGRQIPSDRRGDHCTCGPMCLIADVIDAECRRTGQSYKQVLALLDACKRDAGNRALEGY